jgi:hypothetical protein
MSTKAERLQKLFTANMARVAGLTRLIYTGHEALKPTSIFKHEGVGADLFRAVVVFLHATFEGMLRAHIPNPSKTIAFSGPSDINKALKMSNIDPAPFRHLYKPLGQLAKRRHAIVHHADLSSSGDLEPWGAADHWQVVMWNLTVLAFYYQLCLSTNYETLIAKRRTQSIKDAMDKHVQHGHQLIDFPKVPPEKRFEALDEMNATLTSVIELLTIDKDALVAELLAARQNEETKQQEPS